MAFFYPTSHLNFNLVGKIIVIPIVSTANISQLAVDLLIATLSLKRIGIFDSRDLVPVVGSREDGEQGITTPLELFGRDSVNLIVVQQRSPALKSHKQEFVNSLLRFVKESGVSSVIFLSGVDLSNRTDAQMFTPTYYIHPPNTPVLLSTPLSSVLQLSIPPYTSAVPQRPYIGAPPETSLPFIPGGGLTRRILSSLPSTWSTPIIALLQFVVEGDNRADAHLLAAVTAKVTGTDSLIREWKQPSSWRQGLFGTPHDQTLYG